MSGAATAPDRIVVGVDRSTASRHAVRWAAREARIRRSVLIITHVDPPSDDAADLHDAATACHALLATSATAASEAEPSVPVGTWLLRGSISDELIALSRSAALIVLGIDPDRPRSAHGALGSIEDRVAVQAQCPVVTLSCPASADGGHGSCIAVGWTNDVSGERALAAAAAEADARGACLRIVACTARPDTPGPAEGEDKAEDALQDVLRAVAREYPRLVSVLDTTPAIDIVQTLVRHSANAALLVLGCHHSEDRWSIRVGSTAVAVMRQALCPVMLIGDTPSTSARSSRFQQSPPASKTPPAATADHRWVFPPPTPAAPGDVAGSSKRVVPL